jgi:hypothetical protein
MQCIFLRTDGYREQTYQLLKSHYPANFNDKNATCRLSYADKKGRYQDQKGITNPKVD